MLDLASTHQENIPSADQLGFLRRITEDDQFRAQLEAEPQVALAQYGFQIPEDSLPERVTLPKTSALVDVLIDAEDDDYAKSRHFWYGLLG